MGSLHLSSRTLEEWIIVFSDYLCGCPFSIHPYCHMQSLQRICQFLTTFTRERGTLAVNKGRRKIPVPSWKSNTLLALSREKMIRKRPASSWNGPCKLLKVNCNQLAKINVGCSHTAYCVHFCLDMTIFSNILFQWCLQGWSISIRWTLFTETWSQVMVCLDLALIITSNITQSAFASVRIQHQPTLCTEVLVRSCLPHAFMALH